jgi:hypothetical protein
MYVHSDIEKIIESIGGVIDIPKKALETVEKVCSRISGS